MQTATDSDNWLPANDLNVNPGMGIGFHYHPFDFLMLETLVYVSYDVLNNTAGEHYLQTKVGLGVFYWRNMDNSFSIFFGPKAFLYGIYGAADFSEIVRRQIAGMFGLQYCFSKHFAVFGDFGLGVYWVADGYDYWYFKVMLPEIGFVFYL